MKLNVIPSPKGVCSREKMLFFDPFIAHGDFDAEASVFAEMAAKCHGVNLAFAENGIVTKKTDILRSGEYRISVSEDGIFVFASDPEGASFAFVTLLQLMEIRDGKMMLPAFVLTDAADFKYRGLLIDCARSLHTLDELKKYVDLCHFYKIKYLHIHFSDDQSYTLPSKIFPKLSTEGRCFTFAEIAELDAYAASRHVGIVPEVDTPGHCTSLQTAYPEVFGDRGIISFCERAISAVGDIYREICGMFPHSDYIHIGGDESRLGWWIDWDECTEFGEKCGYSKNDEGPGMSSNEYLMLRYLAHFIKCNAEAVLSCGKKPVVWEGFHKCTDDIVPKNVAVMVFDSSYQLPGELIDAGYEVINCSWFPTYVVTPTWYYTDEDCFRWDVRTYGTINPGSPYKDGTVRLNPADNVIGGQLSSWGDTIESAFPSVEAGHADEMKKIRERLPYIGENVWNRDKLTDFASLRKVKEKLDPVLDRLLG